MARVTVPVAVLAGASVSPGLVDLLGTVHVTVLGYHVLPEQTPPDQARRQYEERANAALADIADEFRNAGGDADYRLVFTGDREQTIQRVAAETRSDAYVVPGVTGEVSRLLVALSGDVDHDRIRSFVTDLVGDREIAVTLLLDVDPAGEADASDRLEAAATELREAGVDVDTRLEVGTGPLEAILAAMPDHDAVVVGERAPSMESFLFGDVGERVAAASVSPVLVVRRPDEETPSDEDGASANDG